MERRALSPGKSGSESKGWPLDLAERLAASNAESRF
jgi:hypothetical protein